MLTSTQINSAIHQDPGEGENYVGSASVSIPGSGIGVFTATFPVAVPLGHVVTATATDSTGNTSQFSRCALVGPPTVFIEGSIRDNNNAPLRNVLLNLTGTRNRTVAADSAGHYRIHDLPAGGNYTATPCAYQLFIRASQPRLHEPDYQSDESGFCRNKSVLPNSRPHR